MYVSRIDGFSVESENAGEAVLFLWGLGLGMVEIKQLESSGFQATLLTGSLPWLVAVHSSPCRHIYTTSGTSWTLCTLALKH